VAAKDDEIEFSDYEIRLAMNNDPEAARLEDEKHGIASYIDATRRALKPGAAGPNLARQESRLQELDKKIEARKEQLRPELTERHRQFAAAAVRELKAKITRLTAHENHYLKKSRELEAELKIRRAPSDVEDLAREIAQRERVLSQLGVEREQTKVELQAE